MTREEAIKYFKRHIELYCVTGICREAEEMAIKALEQEPCEDCISRQAVDELSKALVHTTRDKADFLCNFWEGLRKLPSVIPQSKTGYWIKHDTGHSIYYGCSLCDCLAPCTETADSFVWKLSEYCPDCGAKMVEPQESEDKE